MCLRLKFVEQNSVISAHPLFKGIHKPLANQMRVPVSVAAGEKGTDLFKDRFRLILKQGDVSFKYLFNYKYFVSVSQTKDRSTRSHEFEFSVSRIFDRSHRPARVASAGSNDGILFYSASSIFVF